MRCSRCGRETKSSGGFCRFCGAPLSQKRRQTSHPIPQTRKKTAAPFIVVVICGAVLVILGVLLLPQNRAEKRRRKQPTTAVSVEEKVQKPPPKASPRKPLIKEEPLWKKELNALSTEMAKIKDVKTAMAFVRSVEQHLKTAEHKEFKEALLLLRKDAEKIWRKASYTLLEKKSAELKGKDRKEVLKSLRQLLKRGDIHKDVVTEIKKRIGALQEELEKERAERRKQDERMVELRVAAEGLYDSGRFKDAATKAEELCRLLEKWGRTKEKVYGWAVKLAKRAMVFAQIVSRIPRSPLATHKGIWRIVLETKAVHYGQILSDDGEFVEYQKEGGVRIKLNAERIKEKKPVSPQRYKAYLQKKLDERIRGVDEGDFLHLYTEGVVFARRYGLDERLAELLEKVFRIRGSERVVELVMGRGKVESVVALLEGMDREADAWAYKEDMKSRVTAAKKLPDLPQLTPTQRRDLLTALETQRKADALIGDAINRYGRERFRLGGRALRLLRRAQKTLKRLSALHPDVNYIQKKLADVTSTIGFVQKVLTGFAK